MITKENIVANVITLPKRADRRLLFAAQAQEQGIRYLFSPGQVHTNPATGISMAHRLLVRKAKEQALPYVLIMEDDAWFPARDGFAHFLRNVPAQFDIYLGGIYSGTPDEKGRVEQFSGMHCYIVHARFYDTLLGVKPTDHIDYALKGLGEYYVCQPYACMQRDGFSDNEKEHKAYSTWGKDKVYRGPSAGSGQQNADRSADDADGTDECGPQSRNANADEKDGRR